MKLGRIWTQAQLLVNGHLVLTRTLRLVILLAD